MLWLQDLYDFKFDWRYMMRGLTIDKKRGNILKIDRHKYVKIAYHGFWRLERSERTSIYNAVPPCSYTSLLFGLAFRYITILSDILSCPPKQG